MEAPSADWERRVDEVWAAGDALDEQELLTAIEELAAELGDDSPVAAFERASSLDSTGHSDLAVPLYRRAIELGLGGVRRRRAVIQMASSLRNLGEAQESVALLRAELDRPSDELDDAVRAFLALALAEPGESARRRPSPSRRSLPHLPRYQRSLGNYARELSTG